jgi:hypothetical protein
LRAGNGEQDIFRNGAAEKKNNTPMGLFIHGSFSHTPIGVYHRINAVYNYLGPGGSVLQ